MPSTIIPTIKRALISVSDRTGIIEFAKSLHKLGITILSTGGTGQLLKENNIPIIEVSEYTGFPEIMAGRVKTLHPKIHGGLLGRRGLDKAVMEQHHIDPIDLLVVNLYPFQATIKKPNCDYATAIENIDIGGPAMLRAAAKNHASVTVVVDPNDYDSILSALVKEGGTNEATRRLLAQKVYAHTAQYDAAIANYLQNQLAQQQPEFPQIYNAQWIKRQDLRYGENPHQKAAFYTDTQPPSGSIAAAEQLQGKELSFNNIADSDAALECVKAFPNNISTCVIVKHANPCGVANGKDLLEAYERAYSTDPTSAFGGIIAFNQILDDKTLAAILEKQFVEVIIAPQITEKAKVVAQSKPNIRLLTCGNWDQSLSAKNFHYKPVNGGMLIQDCDFDTLQAQDLKIVSKRKPTAKEIQDLFFAWTVARFVKSNAIIYSKDQLTLGIGAGQMSRVDSAKIAALKAAAAGLSLQGAAMASDAFFPFRDGIDTAANAGITAIIQPGGSMRDAEVIQAADEANIAMVFTGIRHFWH